MSNLSGSDQQHATPNQPGGQQFGAIQQPLWSQLAPQNQLFGAIPPPSHQFTAPPPSVQHVAAGGGVQPPQQFPGPIAGGGAGSVQPQQPQQHSQFFGGIPPQQSTGPVAGSVQPQQHSQFFPPQQFTGPVAGSVQPQQHSQFFGGIPPQQSTGPVAGSVQPQQPQQHSQFFGGIPPPPQQFTGPQPLQRVAGGVQQQQQFFGGFQPRQFGVHPVRPYPQFGTAQQFVGQHNPNLDHQFFAHSNASGVPQRPFMPPPPQYHHPQYQSGGYLPNIAQFCVDGTTSTAFLNGCVDTFNRVLPPVRLSVIVVDFRERQSTPAGELPVANVLLGNAEGARIEASAWRQQAELLAMLRIGDTYSFFNCRTLPPRMIANGVWFRLGLNLASYIDQQHFFSLPPPPPPQQQGNESAAESRPVPSQPEIVQVEQSRGGVNVQLGGAAVLQENSEPVTDASATVERAAERHHPYRRTRRERESVELDPHPSTSSAPPRQRTRSPSLTILNISERPPPRAAAVAARTAVREAIGVLSRPIRCSPDTDEEADPPWVIIDGEPAAGDGTGVSPPPPPPPYPKHKISRLPFAHITQHLINEGETCSICGMPFLLGELVTVLDCLHKFHPDCIEKWLLISRICPICKTVL
ncbi:hypothetical protein niasHT_006107 [Heterodera trifolii]|uniref:RING-type domain-containing protein n=2 Tax=Heterodera trifolii TaxID=157864 RepID=A0ABD2M6H8_9BILA